MAYQKKNQNEDQKNNLPAVKNDNLPAEKNDNLVAVKKFLRSSEMKRRFDEVLGNKAEQFTASIINVVTNNNKLRECDANGVVGAALIAASLDLPIDPNLGFSAIVPYKQSVYNEDKRKWEKVPKAQFQIMTKGLVQLALRSRAYESMHCTEVYADEIIEYNPILGRLRFVDDMSKCTQRARGDERDVVGYFASYKLLAGFSKELYMTKAEVENHARKYSTAYQYDLKNISNGKKGTSPWSEHFDAMAKKTVLKKLIKDWGIMSIKMQTAVTEDQKVYSDVDAGDYADNATRYDNAIPVQAEEVSPVTSGNEVIDVFAESVQEPEPVKEPEKAQPQESQEQPMASADDQTDFAAFEAQFEGFEGEDDIPWD